MVEISGRSPTLADAIYLKKLHQAREDYVLSNGESKTENYKLFYIGKWFFL